MKVDLEDAPPCVRALVDALENSTYVLDLGEFFLVTSTLALHSLAVAVEVAQERAEFEDLEAALATAGPGGTPFDPARSVLVVDDRGGMSSLGVGWSGEQVFFALVEVDDPTEDNLVRVFTAPETFFAHLARVNGMHPPKPDVHALEAAVGLAPMAA